MLKSNIAYQNRAPLNPRSWRWI